MSVGVVEGGATDGTERITMAAPGCRGEIGVGTRVGVSVAVSPT
jgi:hypothetical protein